MFKTRSIVRTIGPLLFILYINDIASCIDDNVFVNLFVNDTLISVEDNDIDMGCNKNK